MELLNAIHSRQSVSNLRPDPVPCDLIEQLLSAAVQAPNHFKVRPWRFVVITGAARERMGEVLAQSLKRQKPECLEGELEKARQRPLRAPVVIAVGVDLPEDSRVIEIENVCAAAAAVQNLLLAAHDLGLGAKWRTGVDAFNPDLKAFLGFLPEQHIIALVYLGYPAVALPAVQRPTYHDRVVWMEE